MISRGIRLSVQERDAIVPNLATFASLFCYLLVTIHDTGDILSYTHLSGASLGIPIDGFHLSFTKNFMGSKHQFLETLLYKLVIIKKIHGFHFNRTKKSTGSTEPIVFLFY